MDEVVSAVQTDTVDTIVAEHVDEGAQNAVQEEGQKAAEEVKKEDTIPRGVQRRIDRAVRQKYEAEARANELERRIRELEQVRHAPQHTGEPDISQYHDINEYIAAKAAYMAKMELHSTLAEQQKQAEASKAQESAMRVEEEWVRRTTAAKAEMPDFDEVIDSSDVVFKDPVVLDVIKTSEIGPKIAYYLAINPEEADSIANMTGANAIRAIGRLEAKLSETGTSSVTRTPPPITPVGQKAKVSKQPNDMNFDEFVKWRQSHIAKR